MANKLKRPHGESLARAPPEARRQPVVMEDADQPPRRRDYETRERPTYERKEPRVNKVAGRGSRLPMPTMPVVVPQAAPAAVGADTKKKKEKKKATKKKQEKPQYTYNTYGPFSNNATIYSFNGDFNKRQRDELTGSFASVHGYKYSRHTTAPKVVKPIELLRFFGDRQAQALQDVLAELALLEQEEGEEGEGEGGKGKERLDADGNPIVKKDRHVTNDGPEEEMQEVLKELVIDLAALNGGKAVQLEPEFAAPAPDFFVADEFLPRNSGHAAKPVFFDDAQLNAADHDSAVQLAGSQASSVFWDESALPAAASAQQASSFGPARPSPFFQLAGGAQKGRKASQKNSAKSINGMVDEEAREMQELQSLLANGFISQEQFEERTGQLKESVRLRKALAKQREAERKREQREEEKLWGERERKLVAERLEEAQLLDEQKKKEITRAVLQDFLEGRIGAKELVKKVKSGVVTVDQLLGLWKTELRPLRLADYYPQSSIDSCQVGPSKHSKILADVMYLLQMSNPTKQHGNTIEPAALPQTREVLSKVEKIAAHNPGLVRKFAHYVRTEREMRTEWQRDVQERLLVV